MSVLSGEAPNMFDEVILKVLGRFDGLIWSLQFGFCGFVLIDSSLGTVHEPCGGKHGFTQRR